MIFKLNPYYPICKSWLNYLNEIYSPERLKIRHDISTADIRKVADIKYKTSVERVSENAMQQLQVIEDIKHGTSSKHLSSTINKLPSFDDIIPTNKPENKKIVLDVLRHFGVIDKNDNYIYPPHGQGLTIHGIIDALKSEKNNQSFFA